MDSQLTIYQESAMVTSVPCAHAGRRADIRSGFGSGLESTSTGLSGTLGEGPGCNERELFFAWFHWGITCLRVCVRLNGPL
jgi:hypothetical protein